MKIQYFERASLSGSYTPYNKIELIIEIDENELELLMETNRGPEIAQSIADILKKITIQK